MKAYLRGLADEFGESTNAIRLELNHMEGVGLLKSESEGNKKVYHANTGHPLFYDIHNLVLKHSGITSIIDQVIEKTGDIEKVWIKGDFAQGKDSDNSDGCRCQYRLFRFIGKKSQRIDRKESGVSDCFF